MTLNPILKVLSTFQKHRVKSLLIGGQACIIYGAAEFSRDSDFVVLCAQDNLERFKKALKALKAELIYVPPLEADYLERGHACHFRCNAEDVRKLRIDVMSKLRGCEPFEKLWERKKTISLKGGAKINVIGLNDLVQSKKTQRDKDWLMLKLLVENDIVLNKNNPASERIKWWFLESRNVQSLINLAKVYPEIAQKSVAKRPLLSSLINLDIQELNSHLQEEELTERRKDIEYWAPLKKELETLRHYKNSVDLS
ncbi:MAG: hypothetical protein V1662_03340 [Candidatus Omnitrophota bacterium]